MAKLGAGNRLAWKERIDQSAWVENAGWLNDGEQPPDGPVEFLEAEPSAYRLSEVTRDASQPIFSSTSARVVGLGGLAIVVLAVALMSRPSDQDPFDQLPPDKQQEIRQRQAGADAPIDEPDQARAEPQRSTDTTQIQPVPTPSAGALSSGDADDLSTVEGEAVPIPPLRADLSTDMPGLLFSYGPTGSVVQIRRSDEQPIEVNLPFGSGSGSGSGSMVYSQVDGLPLVLADGELTAVLPDGLLESASVVADQLLAADGGIVLVTEERSTREVVLSSRIAAGDEPIGIGYDVELLGGWQGRPLVHKAGAVWLLDRDGGAERVTDGVPVGYDGRHLVMVRCDRPNRCRIEVGPPDRPALRSVPVPENLAGREIESWTGSIAVSRDGSRLAVVDRRGVSLPTWIDLDSGLDYTRSESINPDSPVAWSPDGLWVAYAFGDDIIVWDTGADRSWRIFLDRPITDLTWTDDPSAE